MRYVLALQMLVHWGKQIYLIIDVVDGYFRSESACLMFIDEYRMNIKNSERRVREYRRREAMQRLHFIFRRM